MAVLDEFIVFFWDSIALFGELIPLFNDLVEFSGE